MTKKATFETAYTSLKNTVEKIENGETTIDEAISLFEEGVKHYRQCIAILDEAEQKIELVNNAINKSEEGLDGISESPQS